MRILLIGNPASRRGGGLARTQAAERLLRSAGAQVDLRLTERVGHAREIAANPPADVDRVAACGGDGLLSEVTAALKGGALPLAILPGGRGNDLARELKVPLDIEGACALAVAGVETRIDLGEANGRTFNTIAACGLDAEVSRRARSARIPLPGEAVYLLELARALFGFRGAHATLEIDGVRHEEDVLLLAVANSSSYGGGIRIAPRASIRDGALDVCLVRRIPAWKALGLLPLVQVGRHESRAEVRTWRASEIRLSTEPGLVVEADGEPLASTPVLYRCLPAALPVVVPRG